MVYSGLLLAQNPGENKRDAPIIGAGDRVLSPRDILKEIQQGTELGIDCVNSYAELEKEILGEEAYNKKYDS